MQPNSNAPIQPTSSPQPLARPVHNETASSPDPGTADLTKTGAVFSDINASTEPANPIAGTSAPMLGAIHEQAAEEQSLDGVLRQVTTNIKSTSPASSVPQKKKKGFFGGGKPKKPHPAAASHGPTKPQPANPIHQAPPKPKKPILAIAFAVLAAIGLGVAAVMAF